MSGFSDLVKRVKESEPFRIKFILRLSLTFNFLYSCFLFCISLIYSSNWFLLMSIYYGMLCVVRIFLLVKIEQTSLQKIIVMRRCGYFLLVLNCVVSAMMLVLNFRENNVGYHEIVVITIATYTFSTLTLAVVGSVKQYKKSDRIYFSIKIISLISSCVSMVTLTNTMLATFGSDNDSLRRIILPILSGMVSVFIILSAVFLIFKANLDLRMLKNEK